MIMIFLCYSLLVACTTAAAKESTVPCFHCFGYDCRLGECQGRSCTTSVAQVSNTSSFTYGCSLFSAAPQGCVQPASNGDGHRTASFRICSCSTAFCNYENRTTSTSITSTESTTTEKSTEASRTPTSTSTMTTSTLTARSTAKTASQATSRTSREPSTSLRTTTHTDATRSSSGTSPLTQDMQQIIIVAQAQTLETIDLTEESTVKHTTLSGHGHNVMSQELTGAMHLTQNTIDSEELATNTELSTTREPPQEQVLLTFAGGTRPLTVPPVLSVLTLLVLSLF